MRANEIAAELRRRAERFLGQRRLFVDYYRIRRKLSFPWPVGTLPSSDFAVQSANYPWHVWFSWEVEERLNALGWWGEISGDESVRASLRTEVLGIARWPRHFEGKGSDMPGLGMSHLLRTLLAAKRRWGWLGETVGAEISAACRRAVEQKSAWLAEDVRKFQKPGDITQYGVYEATQITKNIPLISALVMTMAAAEAGANEELAVLQKHLYAMLKVHLDLVSEGMTEGIAYDGYVLDFMGDWLESAGAGMAAQFGNHPAVAGQLKMPLELAAPGDPLNVANLSDVEPREMTFYVSGAAKIAKLRGLTGEVAWHLGSCRLDWLRSETLGLMHGLAEKPVELPAAGARKGVYAMSLRSGWEADDLAVVMSAGHSMMHHMHHDAGSIMIGHRGGWLVADPGYQQYLPKKEREFTLGAQAHNGPVINGAMQTEKGARQLEAEAVGPNVWRMAVDMTECYPAEAKVRRAVRRVWLIGKQTVVVGDFIDGDVEKLGYTWHGLAEAGWWAQEGKAVICHQDAELWVSSPAVQIEQRMIDRLPGSRGHLSLSAPVTGEGKPIACWWIFCLGRPADCRLSGGGLVIDGVELKLE